MLSSLVSLVTARPAAAACANTIACENQLPGDPASDWQVNGIGDSTIQGFATSMSVNAAQTEDVLVDSRGFIYLTDKNHGVFIVKQRA